MSEQLFSEPDHVTVERIEMVKRMLEKAFDDLATALSQAEWTQDEIDMIAEAVYHGVTQDTSSVLLPLKMNKSLASLRPGEEILWQQWVSGMSLGELAGEYDDSERHSIDQLRMQIANLVAKIARLTD